MPTVTRCQTWKVANLIILRERLLFATFFTLTVSNHKSESSFWFRMELSIKLFSSSSTRSRLWWNERYEKKVEFAKSNFQGSDLLHTLGVETHNLDPALYFVPWILFNGVRRYILKNLKSLLIRFLSRSLSSINQNFYTSLSTFLLLLIKNPKFQYQDSILQIFLEQFVPVFLHRVDCLAHSAKLFALWKTG